MDARIQKLAQAIHDSPTMAVIAAAGAGNQAIGWLLGVAGASRTVLEIIVPYSSTAFVEFLGHAPEQFVASQTARELARSAYRRAVHLREDSKPVVGIACTATIATDRPKRGEHRCHVAAWSASGVTTYSLQLVKGLRDREAEDAAVSKLLLRALAESSAVKFELALDLDERECVEVESIKYDDAVSALMAGHVGAALVRADGGMAADAPTCRGGGILPGSFNPLHEGHERLAAAASAILNAEVTFELSAANVDKPPLAESEVRKRIAQFAGKHPIVVTQALVFYQKARLFPGCAFVIGCDTAVRVVDPRYYDGKESRMLLALEEMRGLGCRFLVAGRVHGGRFHTLDDVPIPQEFMEMFAAIPESAFRMDLSSTELRLAGRPDTSG